jgi:hypothetical protein
MGHLESTSAVIRASDAQAQVSTDRGSPRIDALQDALDRATLHTDLSSITACSAAFGTMRWTSPT